MLRDRKDYPTAITPKGVAIWPSIDRPDYKFKENGEYHARLRLSPDSPGLAELIHQAEVIRDEAFAAKKASLEKQKKGALLRELHKVDVVKPELDQETGEETGYVILRAALTARVDIKNGPRAGESFEKKPDVFDRVGKRLKNPPRVGNGSELKLAVRIMDYETDGGKAIGARFELEGVQIITLVQGGARTAADYGFGEEEGDDIEDGSDDNSPFGGAGDDNDDI